MTYGHSRSIQDVVQIIQRHFPGAGVEYVKRDDLMPFRGTLSITRAERLLGYSARNNLEAGFAKYIGWYRELLTTFDGQPKKEL